jgi:MoaA/NifB/PqqE/SkfB family radical SAM enzyme
MTARLPDALQPTTSPPGEGWKLWLYTNFDCNLRCTYCVAESSPRAPRRALPLEAVRRLVDEAAALGFARVYFTGGEPFLLPDIYAMLEVAAARLPCTVLTNGMLLRGSRLERLAAVAQPNLQVQVSLDGGSAAPHDAYRGPGSWVQTVAGIRLLLERGIHVVIGTTTTPANHAHLDELHEFRRSLGIPDDAHFVRPLAKRGFSTEGIDVSPDSLVPELTVTVDGVFWHPLAGPDDHDLLVRREIFPLAAAVAAVQARLAVPLPAGQARCAFT